MRRLFHFFGSIHFAISLIATTALFVVAGTLIESWADSHQYAASWTYEHPAFLVLLFFFFVNILFSALRRWPFQKKHIPFLITHLGLLMIITGVAFKTLYGLQGVMTLVEGSGSDQVLIPNSKALRIEDRENRIAFYAADDREAPFQLIGYAPHSKVGYEYWIKGNNAFIQGLPPFPVFKWENGEIPISGRAKFTEQENWQLVALRTKNAEDAVKALQHQQSSTLAFIQDENDDTHLYFIDKLGNVHHQNWKADQLPTLAVYDEGFGGYSAVADIPYYAQNLEEINTLFLNKLSHELQNADPETLSPPLKFVHEHVDKNLGTIISDIFRNWETPEKAEIPPLEWNSIDPAIYNGLQWAAHFLENNQNIDDWPVSIPQGSREETETALVQQLISIGDRLPTLGIRNDSRLLKAYLLAYGIFPKAIMPPLESLGVKPEPLSIETPLTFRIQQMKAEKKLEDNRPIATFKFPNDDTKTLAYDPSGMGLCLPACKGKYLVRFQPKVRSIPYHVRLRNARQIAYANSQQPFSYEAEVVINGREKTLSMNQVHETWDGYRFYLSSISPTDESRVKKVQLIVNRDPAKYWLTYPGGTLVSLGILLLFWWKPKKG